MHNFRRMSIGTFIILYKLKRLQSDYKILKINPEDNYCSVACCLQSKDVPFSLKETTECAHTNKRIKK